MRGVMRGQQRIAQQHPEYYETSNTFVMSGTSQSAAVVSGAAALLLQTDPTLSPDDVKCRLMSTARPGVKPNGSLAYSVFQQGAGLVNAYNAVNSQASGCANRGLDVSKDLTGAEHYGGRANQNSDGSFFLRDLSGDGYLWTDDGPLTGAGYLWTDGFIWTDGFVWTEGYLWTDGALWYEGGVASTGYVWTDGLLSSDGYSWTGLLSETMSINSWVEQE